MAQTPVIHVALSDNMSHGYQHRPQLQLDHGPRHGAFSDVSHDVTMAPVGSAGHSDSDEPNSCTALLNTYMTLGSSNIPGIHMFINGKSSFGYQIYTMVVDWPWRGGQCFFNLFNIF